MTEPTEPPWHTVPTKKVSLAAFMRFTVKLGRGRGCGLHGISRGLWFGCLPPSFHPDTGRRRDQGRFRAARGADGGWRKKAAGHRGGYSATGRQPGLQFLQCDIRKDGDALLDTGPIGVGSGLHPQASRRHPRALPIASPLKSGCATLFSKDLQDGQVVDGRLTIRNPFGTSGQ